MTTYPGSRSRGNGRVTARTDPGVILENIEDAIDDLTSAYSKSP